MDDAVDDRGEIPPADQRGQVGDARDQLGARLSGGEVASDTQADLDAAAVSPDMVPTARGAASEGRPG